MKLFQRLSVVYVVLAGIFVVLMLAEPYGELFTGALIATIGIGALHGFIVCIREYRRRYLPHLIGFALILLCLMLAAAIIFEIPPFSDNWDFFEFLVIAGLIMVATILFLAVYSIALWIYDRVKKQ